MNENLIYPPCKICGKSHGMGIEERETGKIEPIDLCYDCLWGGVKFNVITEKITLNEFPEICDTKILQNEKSDIMQTLFVDSPRSSYCFENKLNVKCFKSETAVSYIQIKIW